MPFCFLPFRRTAGLTLAAVLCPFSVPADTELNIPGYRLIWNDEFEEAVVDASRWEVNVGVNAWYVRQSDNRTIEPHWFGEPYEPYTNAGTINNERQYYHPDNVTVDDGVLQIEARVESIQSPVGIYNPSFHRYTSGKLNTADEFQFQYGIVKWRAQLPAGQGMWPALWMLNAPNPWFWDQEIDVMEAKGSLPFESSSAHHFKVGPNNSNVTNSRELGGTDNLQQGFHEYGLEWTSTLIRTWRDEAEVFTDTQDVPQEPMFLIMNAAVGGNFDGEPQSDAIFPSHFLIDWVRVWQPTLTPSDLSNGGFERYQGPQWADWNTLDDGNLETVTDGALHGTSSVRIKRRNEGASAPSPADNLLTNGTAAGWNAWLNQLNANGEETGGGFTDLTAIPATATGNTVTTGLHQTAPSPRANAVVFRELSGSFARGKTLTYTGTVSINSAFPGDASAHAFIRIFNPDYSFNDVAVSVLAGGDFTLEATIPAANVPIVQVGVETIGPTGGSGSLTASSLFLLDTTGGAQPDTVSTGFQQTVTAEVGQTFRYGVLTANDSADPMTSSASGRLRLQFFDVNGAQLSEQVTPLTGDGSPATAMPTIGSAVAPIGTKTVRLSIERLTNDSDNDTSGSFLADVAFLQNTGNSELPIFTSEPPLTQTVDSGQLVQLAAAFTSSAPATTQWYRNGAPLSTLQNYSFTATSAAEGTYYLVVENAAGPVIGAVTEITVNGSSVDADGDLLSDADETNVYGTNPFFADTDHDGITDHGELFLTLTDPLAFSSALRVTSFQLTGSSLSLSFPSVASVTYTLMGSGNLEQWVPVGSPLTASGAISVFNETVPVANPPIQFFRIRVSP